MKTHLMFALFLSFETMSGCKGDPGNAGPGGPGLSGNLHGFVRLYRPDGTAETTYAGVRVLILTKSYTTTTDSLGMWTLSNVSTGIYTIVLSKPGYGFTKLTQVQFVGGGDLTLEQVNLSEAPDYGVSTINARINSRMATVYGTLSTSVAYTRFLLVCYGKIDPVASDPTTYLESDGAVCYSLQNTYTTPERDSNYFFSEGFRSGDTVHVAVYPASVAISGYRDAATGRFVFSTGISAIASRVRFVLP